MKIDLKILIPLIKMSGRYCTVQWDGQLNQFNQSLSNWEDNVKWLPDHTRTWNIECAMVVRRKVSLPLVNLSKSWKFGYILPVKWEHSLHIPQVKKFCDNFKLRQNNFSCLQVLISPSHPHPKHTHIPSKLLDGEFQKIITVCRWCF